MTTPYRHAASLLIEAAVTAGAHRANAFTEVEIREFHEREGADLAAMLVQKAVWSEACIARPLVLHADNRC